MNEYHGCGIDGIFDQSVKILIGNGDKYLDFLYLPEMDAKKMARDILALHKLARPTRFDNLMRRLFPKRRIAKFFGGNGYVWNGKKNKFEVKRTPLVTNVSWPVFRKPATEEVIKEVMEEYGGAWKTLSDK